ncbi:hypothetical protein [Luteitalea sp.]|uniref:hypothetical protein n=1 Tax=Luteitalea sp. TaxID=2004800 RepID=UPI0025C01B3E|nr:hypothetical protein [Luteitalea sp.]
MIRVPVLALPTVAALLLLGTDATTRAVRAQAGARLIPTPAMALPPYLAPVVDPVFGTSFTRVTDPGRPLLPGVSCGVAHCTHRYSSAQAWNADQSLLVIAHGCSHGFCFLHGQTHQPLFHRPMSSECEWSPTDPESMICVSRHEIYTWQPRGDIKTTVYRPTEYTNLDFGPWKGNPSDDGTRLVVRAVNARGALVAFAYDIATRTKYPDVPVAELPGRNVHCSIAPSGRYIGCFQTTAGDVNEAFFFTLDGTPAQHFHEHHRPGHGDMMVDEDGNDVYVGISKADPDKWHVIKRRIKDGAVTDLSPSGYGQHASLRNIRRSGWVFVGFIGTYSSLSGRPERAPFYQEIVALRTDGSGEARRIVQTRNANHDYWSETRASPSPDGSQVIWSSNWGRAGGPVSDYVARLAWPDTATRMK